MTEISTADRLAELREHLATNEARVLELTAAIGEALANEDRNAVRAYESDLSLARQCVARASAAIPFLVARIESERVAAVEAERRARDAEAQRQHQLRTEIAIRLDQLVGEVGSLWREYRATLQHSSALANKERFYATALLTRSAPELTQALRLRSGTQNRFSRSSLAALVCNDFDTATGGPRAIEREAPLINDDGLIETYPAEEN